MLEMREGVTDSLVDMVSRVIGGDDKYKERFPKNPKEKLENMDWCFGFYDGDRCAFALWGNEEICLCGDPFYKGRWSRGNILRVFKFLFKRYNPVCLWAKADTDEMKSILRRMGFVGTKEKMRLGI